MMSGCSERSCSGECRKIADILRTPGAVVLLPTETLYGLVCRAADEAACRRIFALKSRSYSKLLGWFVSGKAMLEQYGVEIAGLPEKLIDTYTPGALTVIAPRRGGGTQGFRIPQHQLILEVLELLGEPLAQTSANASGAPDPRSCQEALAQLNGTVDFYVDGGVLPENPLGSTVVDVSGGELKIIRKGVLDISGFVLDEK